jgi:hypothetical protein
VTFFGDCGTLRVPLALGWVKVVPFFFGVNTAVSRSIMSNAPASPMHQSGRKVGIAAEEILNGKLIVIFSNGFVRTDGQVEINSGLVGIKSVILDSEDEPSRAILVDRSGRIAVVSVENGSCQCALVQSGSIRCIEGVDPKWVGDTIEFTDEDERDYRLERAANVWLVVPI